MFCVVCISLTVWFESFQYFSVRVEKSSDSEEQLHLPQNLTPGTFREHMYHAPVVGMSGKSKALFFPVYFRECGEGLGTRLGMYVYRQSNGLQDFTYVCKKLTVRK